MMSWSNLSLILVSLKQPKLEEACVARSSHTVSYFVPLCVYLFLPARELCSIPVVLRFYTSCTSLGSHCH